MHSKISNWENKLIESEEETLHALAVFIRLVAERLRSIQKMMYNHECNEIELQAVATLALLQVIHVNLLQRKWLLAEMGILDGDGMQKDHVEMIDSIQELEQVIEQHHFISKVNYKKMKEILKQISVHYHTAVKTIIEGNSRPSSPWRPKQE